MPADDGVTRMTMLDQATTAGPLPAIWTTEIVRERLVEAFEIDRRMPG